MGKHNRPGVLFMDLPNHPDELVDEIFVADYYRVKPRTVRLWRYQGRGPEYIRVASNQVRYRWGALLEFNGRHSASDKKGRDSCD